MSVFEGGNLATDLDFSEEIADTLPELGLDLILGDQKNILPKECSSQSESLVDALRGLRFEVLSEKRVLSREEEVFLAKMKDEGSVEARKILIEVNLRLVFKIARMYRGMGLDFSDLVQEGNIGLIRAVDGFDHAKGCKFSTYANWWIFQSIERALQNNQSTIRLPVYVHEAIRSYRSAVNHLRKEFEREPDVLEVANILGTSEEAVEFLASHGRPELSIDCAIGGKADASDGKVFGSFLKSDANPRQDNVAIANQLREMVLDCMRKALTFEEMSIISVRWEAWECMVEHVRHGKEALFLVDRLKKHLKDSNRVSLFDIDVFFGIAAKDDLETEKEVLIMEAARQIMKREEAWTLLWWIGCGGEKLTLQNIGDLLGISREAVRQRERVIREKLRKRIKGVTGFDARIDPVSKQKAKTSPEPKKMNLHTIRFHSPGSSIRRKMDSHFVGL